ncbi:MULTISPECIES: bifunctional 2-polyprenyl-6-hydroxyphenol methylase/3-demethylubiquinol 3-O-methyltransferase UbiG [Alphaproteobacteria]|uniref:Ubiquinone biosynthesis O-methyltransferase n=2 Tax=Alphaproteobacteria TaxID=28211 RepID=A0A934TJW3_9RHOB|nr:MULTISPECIES: bifunctional 2-polyprenyl-6-hydroxyphenol methylase/3-demethylubiquinol 3-O-methyltransferase UbiG [Alphaproteobacteria]MBK1697128.1 bifunctional 2-polyprenyl-6-hydroxyphenol methylase/3-demethylubiquinol 3-O-methyltransferase UbiG [Rhodovibrio salinarum]MBK5926871.1 bifunctional 3-demethylubiquinone 3-O-methyltransferase/2-octaprenyl-6-hydroxy phenol methylase [Rhodobaculum claviforme]
MDQPPTAAADPATPPPARVEGVSVDPQEIGKFARMAESWWDPEGDMKPLHALNPVRVGYIRDRLATRLTQTQAPGESLQPLAGISILDVGCGAGLLAEPLARLGARVTGIDASAEAVKTGKAHAEMQGLAIDYRIGTVEALAETGQQFDAVTIMEVIEHVPDVDTFLATCGRLVRPGGLAVVSSVNRTAKSFLLAKVGAEYLLGWLPRGTHDWRRFVKPSEAARGLRAGGLRMAEVAGVAFDPLTGWHTARDSDVNYMILAEKPAGG